jgi:hypothetical protein
LVEQTTIELSAENKGKLRSLADQLEKITRKTHVSLDEALSVVLAIKSLDVVLQDMILEDRPEWTSSKKFKKKN